MQGATGGFGTGFTIGFAGGKGVLGVALLAAARGAIWGAFFGGVLGAGSRFLFIGGKGEHQFFELGTFNRYLPEKAGDFNDALNVGDNAAGTVEDAAFTGSHAARGTLAWGDLGDVIDVTTLRDVGQKTYEKIGGDLVAFGKDSSLVLVDVGQVASALAKGGVALAASGSVMLDASGYSYANQLALLLKAVPVAGNFLALSDERKLGWYDDATKGFDAFFGSRSPHA